MNTHDIVKQIKADFRLGMNGIVSTNMRKEGYNYRVNFGVEIPRIKQIAAKYEKNHELAQALWKEDIRECKIIATMLQPHDSFCKDIANIWVENINNIEIAEICCMNLFQHLDYAPNVSFQWIADGREFVQVCGYLTIARLISKKDNMDERTYNEFISQAMTAIYSDKYNVVNAAILAIRKYMQKCDENAFKICRIVENMENSNKEVEKALYNMVKSEVEE